MAKNCQCKLPASVDGRTSTTKKDQLHSLPEISEFLRDEWSQNRNDTKGAHTLSVPFSMVLPKQESNECQVHNSYPISHDASPMRNQALKQTCLNFPFSGTSTTSKQSENFDLNPIFHNCTERNFDAKRDEIYLEAVNSMGNTNYKINIQGETKKLTKADKALGQSSSKYCPNTVPLGNHEYHISRPCSFSELLNDGLFSQPADTLNAPTAFSTQAWEMKNNCCQFESIFEVSRPMSNGQQTSNIKPTITNKMETSLGHCKVVSGNIHDFRFSNACNTSPHCTSHASCTSQMTDSSHLASTILNTAKRPLDGNIATNSYCQSQKKIRVDESGFNVTKAVDNLNSSEANDTTGICNHLFEDIDLSAVDKKCMEQLEREYQNEAVKEVEFACSLLNLDKDPRKWDETQVQKWVMWTIHQCRLSSIDVTAFEMSGEKFCSMTEKMMRSLAPLCGDILHARLDVWRSVAKLSGNQTHKHYRLLDVENTESGNSKNAATNLIQAVSNGDLVETMTPNHTSGIHLWQFLKELLLQPDRYNHCIRWIDKDQGVFKIEDSVEVARLWGVRKNRPAMNYDKLSRSIRQYYKKGIIRKTDISQRLVYQFVKKII